MKLWLLSVLILFGSFLGIAAFLIGLLILLQLPHASFVFFVIAVVILVMAVVGLLFQIHEGLVERAERRRWGR